jgi:hypothetical protein
MSKITENRQEKKVLRGSSAQNTHNISDVVSTSKVRELTEIIAAIPNKSKGVQFVATLNEMVDKIEGAQKRLEWSLSSERFASPMLNVPSIDAVRSAAKKAAQQAKKFEQLISTELASILNSQARNCAIEINERATDAQSTVRTKWKSFIEDRVTDYSQLLDAVRSAKLKGSDTLERALGALSAVKETPPSTPRDAELTENKLAAVRKSVEDLNLEGAARDFIVAASQGKGDAKSLLNNDVVSFLNAHPSLWKLLRVSLT